MTLIPLNRRNFVHNNVEVSPTISYVSASNLFSNFDKIQQDEPGSSGGVHAIGTYSPRVKEINPYYILDHVENTNIRKVNSSLSIAQDQAAKEAIAAITGEIVDTNTYLNNVDNLDVLHKNTYEFGINRIQQRYMPFDINLQKKFVIKNNIYDFYRSYRGNDIIENPSWSFTNYNCINFFTIGSGKPGSTTRQIGWNDSLIHQNAIVYPNINKQYDFTGNEYTISFWINPRYKQSIGQPDQKGCIINIPGFINIFLLGGDSRDEDGLPEKFKIGTQFGYDTFGFDDTFRIYKTADCLNFNSWHNVVIKIKLSGADKNNIIFSLYVDKNIEYEEKLDLFDDYDPIQDIDDNIICIGNKFSKNYPEGFANEDDDFANKVKILTDSYSDKFVDAGLDRKTQIEYFIIESQSKNTLINSDNLNYRSTFIDKINNVGGLFKFRRNESHALEAELHDIRIYKSSISDSKIIELYESGLKSSVVEEEDLIFYVPVYFIPENIVKKTFINGAKGEENRVAKTSYNFVTNPYYFNNCGGHQVSIELFLLEWVRKSRPNIILGNRINDDYSNDIVNDNIDTENTASQSFIESKLGKPFHEIYLNSLLTVRDDRPTDNSLDYVTHFPQLKACHIYDNYLIMPCDNGLQSQNFGVIKENFSSSIVTASYMFEDFNKTYSYGKVNIENSFVQDINDDYFPLPLSPSIENDFLEDLIITNDDSPIELSLNSPNAVNNIIQLPHQDILFNISNANYHESSIGNVDFETGDRRNLDSFEYDINNFYFHRKHVESNPVVRNYSKGLIDNSGNSLDEIKIQRQFPLFKVTQDPIEFHSVIFEISNQLYNRKIKKETFSIADYDLFGTAGKININLKESGRGMLYRADALTKHAEWNHIGHIFYSEGFCTILHPSLYTFGKTNFSVKFESENAIFVSEVNIPLAAGLHNKSHNKSYDADLKASESAYEKDQKFVYISEINLHDESLNIVARAKLAQPVVKRETDNMVFRLKMDY